MVRFFAIGVWLVAVLSAAQETPALERARRLYNQTDYDASLRVLTALPEESAEAYALMGRNHYQRGDFKRATGLLEKAAAADPENADHFLWLGRAYGRRAETSSFVTAPGYATKARKNFEKAVELDPRHQEALNDLFSYYLEAPGFLGGGFDKATRLIDRIAALDPAEGLYARARLAEKRKEFGSAEKQLRRAAELAPQQVGRLIDLAKFLADQGRYQESEQSFQRAEKIAPDSPKLLYERAGTYIRSGRNLDKARELLKRYLEANLTPDDPPRQEAKRLLQQVSGS
jgi:tetratricopeptide (TPR) repeat protein